MKQLTDEQFEAIVNKFSKTLFTIAYNYIRDSFMLPNGVIVIVEEDIDTYIEGTLIFNYPLICIMSDYDLSKYILKRR